jgi:hypothetical protein
MRISSRSAILILSLLAISLVTSVVSHSASGITETNKSGAAASEGDLTTKNVTQKIDNHDSNLNDSQLTTSNPFEEKVSIQKLNLSDASISQDKLPTNKGSNQSSITSSHASDSCAKDGNEVCKDKQKTSKKNNNDSKNKDGTGDKVQKHSTKPDVKSIKEKVKSEIKDRFKLPIDIPFP